MDRYDVRMQEMEESLRIIEQALASIPGCGDYLNPDMPESI